MTKRFFVFTPLLLTLTAGCGGSTPEPQAPVEPPSEAPEAPPVEEPIEEPIEEPVEEAPADDGPPGPTGRTPMDIVSAEDARFVLSFTSSEAGIAAGEACDEKHPNDPRGRNQCMKTARSKVKEDVLQFELGKLGKWVWTTSSQQGSTLRPLRQVNFTWGEETKNSIEIITSRNESVVIGVPNNYSIVIDNPVHGKLTYDSKRSQ